MFRTVTATEAKQNFSRLLREAAAGETVMITQRGPPSVRMTRMSEEDALVAQADAVEEALVELRARPNIAAGPWRREDLSE